MMKSKLATTLATASVLLSSSSAFAATVVATNNEFAGSGVPLFTPSYDPIDGTNNVLAGLAASASSGNFTTEISGGLAVLTDGAFGEINNDGGPTATHPALAAFGPGGGAGTSVTYSFAATSLSSVVVFGGWNDGGRDHQSYTVEYSVNGTDFLTLGSVDFNPVGTEGQSAVRVTFTDDAGNLAGGAAITDLRFNAAGNIENGYAGLAEIVAYSAVPEPSTALLGMIAGLGLLRRRR